MKAFILVSALVVQGVPALAETAPAEQPVVKHGYYPLFQNDHLLATNMGTRAGDEFEHCVKQDGTRTGITLTCDVQQAHRLAPSSTFWRIPSVRQTASRSRGGLVEITWQFEEKQRAAVTDQLKGMFGDMPAALARPDTWCARNHIITVEDVGDGFIVRAYNPIVRGQAGIQEHLRVCGEQHPTIEDQTDDGSASGGIR